VAPLPCDRWRGDDEVFDRGAWAAIRCASPGPGIAELALFSLTDAATLDAFWRWRLEQLDPRPAEAADACLGGGQGVTTWTHGVVVCHIPDVGRRLAMIRWTDARTNTYGVLDATIDDMGIVHDWWMATDPSATEPEWPGAVTSADPSLTVPQGAWTELGLEGALDPERCTSLRARAVLPVGGRVHLDVLQRPELPVPGTAGSAHACGSRLDQ
jgi:hypothetical protein